MRAAALSRACVIIALWGLSGILVPPVRAQSPIPSAGTAAVQYADVGEPLIENISTSVLGFGAMNWSVARDASGILYVGNNEGILEYDGVSWNMVRSVNGSAVFCLTSSDDGTIYFGLYGGFGRLVTGPNGRHQMELLSDLLPKKEQGFTYVYGVHAIGNTVWFRSEEGLFRWDGSNLTTIHARGPFKQSHVIDGLLYVLVENVGLHLVGRNGITLAPGGGQLKQEGERAFFMLPGPDGRILVGTKYQGLLYYDYKSFTPAWSAAVRARHPKEIYCGTLLSDSSWAIGTLRQGIWILGRDGMIRKIIDDNNGLQNNAVVALLADREGMLWAALDNGLSRIEWPSNITVFGRDSRLTGTNLDVTYFKDRLYVSTTQGLFRLRQGDRGPTEGGHGANRVFELLESLPWQGFDLQVCHDQLLIAAAAGVYSYDGRNANRIIMSPSRRLHRIHGSNDSILVGMEDGILLLVRSGAKWNVVTPAVKVEGFVMAIRETPDGTIWLSFLGGKITSLETGAGFKQWRATNFNGFVDGRLNPPTGLSVIRGTLWFWTEDTLCMYDAKRKSFLPNPEFWHDLGVPPEWTVRLPIEDGNGNVWMQLFTPERLYGCSFRGGRRDDELTLLTQLNMKNVVMIRSTVDDVIWFGTDSELFRFQRMDGESPRRSFPVFVRSIVSVNNQIYVPTIRSEDTTIELRYSDQGVRINFAAPSFIRSDLMQYRWKLVGLNQTWGEWSHLRSMDYPALSEGLYTFHVIARRADGAVSDQATIQIRILPPWQRSWWAYLLYFFIASLIFAVVLRYRTRSLEERSRDLETTVRERTQEISNQAAKIRSQAEELETLDSIVRTVNKEVRLTDLLSALLQQTLLLFPHVDVAGYFQRSAEDGLFRLVATVGVSLEHIEAHAFSLAELIDDPSNSIQSIQDGVYVLRGLEKHWNLHEESLLVRQKAFMGMSDMQHGLLRGFLILGSERMQNFSADDLRRLLRLREHVSSAVAKAVAIRELETKNAQLDTSNKQLRETQQQLIVHEKLAALGELTAGIAHEIQNPLNFVNNFSSLSLELLDELEEDLGRALKTENTPVFNLIATVRGNCERIREHGMRATSIVSAMLMHTRKGSARREMIAFNEFLDQFVMLSYHGMRMLHPQYELKLHTEYDRSIEGVHLSPQEMSRVIVNVCNNAWEAAIDHVGVNGEVQYPEVTVRSVAAGENVRILVRDNGAGIPDELRGRIFEPFFTTKRSGNNAGLGLSMSYEIVTQMHKGSLVVESEANRYSEFIIEIPLK